MTTRFESNVMKLFLPILCMLSICAAAQDLPKYGPADDVKALQAKPTPKSKNGHPDISGRWANLNLRAEGARNIGGTVKGNVHDLYFGTPIEGADPETDSILTQYGNSDAGGGTGEDRRVAREAKNKPSYKPEFQAKVEMLGKDPNHYDPTNYSCLPAGVPRIGAPGVISETPGLVVFLYGPRPYSTFRVIPTDGRAHRKGDDYDPNPMGDPVGHWEGNTLVVETTGFDDSTWFGSDGYFHTDAMKVTERLTRKGDTLEYSAVVEDPKVLTAPFNLNPTPLVLKKGDANDILYNGDYPCDISDPAHDFRSHADHENHL